LPGSDPGEITVSWGEGVLNVVAQHEDEQHGELSTFHQRFRFPKTVDDEDIAAEYTNGVLEVRLPIEDAGVSGREIEIDA